MTVDIFIIENHRTLFTKFLQLLEIMFLLYNL